MHLAPTRPARRNFLKGLGGLGLACALPAPALAARPAYRLKMHNAHTGENFNEVLVEGSKWIPGALDAFSHFSRDWREDLVIDINPDSVLLAIKIQLLLESSTPTLLLSGYRSPQTNRKLPGAAKNSLHMKGWALDIHQSDRSLRQLHRAATTLHGGGVGYYPNDGFVHIDCGPKRHWVG